MIDLARFETSVYFVFRGFLLLALLTSLGCTITHRNSGDQLSDDDLLLLAELETKAQVLEVLGPPTDMELRIDGSVFHYRFRVERGSSLQLSAFEASLDRSSRDRQADRLLVQFDKAGQITRYGLDQALIEVEER